MCKSKRGIKREDGGKVRALFFKKKNIIILICSLFSQLFLKNTTNDMKHTVTSVIVLLACSCSD